MTNNEKTATTIIKKENEEKNLPHFDQNFRIGQGKEFDHHI